MPAPVCVSCLKFMKPRTNGIIVEERMPTHRPDPTQTDWGPYKLWEADLWQCPRCKQQIIMGWGRQAFAEHHEDDYSDKVNKIEAAGQKIYRINDC